MSQEDGWIDAYTPKCVNNECFMIANYNGWKSVISVSGVTSEIPKLRSLSNQSVTGLYGVSSTNELYTY